MLTQRSFSIALFFLYLLLLPGRQTVAATPDLEDRTREIATELRCVVCQNLSVADSPSEMAQQMRTIVREQLQAGKSPQEVKDFFVSKYGEWVLLKPKTSGVSALLWWLPYVGLTLGVIAALLMLRKWANKRSAQSSATPPVSEQARSEILRQDVAQPDIEDNSLRAQLLRERSRLRDELQELEFDHTAGKLSAADYTSLRQDVEAKAAAVIGQIETTPKEVAKETPAKKTKPSTATNAPESRARLKRWQLIAGGAFLLLFGLALGVLLTQSLKPRASEQESMTGDFMTGTAPANADVRAAMAEGKAAFGKQDYPKAIEAFKKVLAADPNQPEAHAYMGFILIQAGHGDGALMAFEKALATAPNFPIALWGKGMVLYQDKKDYAGARDLFEKLMTIMPPGEERNEVAKVLAEIPAAGSAPQKPASPTPTAKASGQTISGKITIDAKLKDKIDPQAAIFIIARPAGGPAGPPLAVKKIAKPTFPLDYSLGADNVMMQGMPFTGKINITVRLDKDGNPTTRGPGDLTGEYKKNPAEVGAKNVDIVVDQALQ